MGLATLAGLDSDSDSSVGWAEQCTSVAVKVRHSLPILLSTITLDSVLILVQKYNCDS